MHFDVGGIFELLRHPGSGGLCDEFVGAGDGTVHALLARREFELRAIGEHQAAALDGHAVGHDQNHRVPFHRADHGEADAGIARGGLDDGAAGLELAALLRRLDHGEADAVLDRAAGVGALGLDPDVLPGAEQPVDADVRGVSDGGEDAVCFHGVSLRVLVLRPDGSMRHV